MLKAKRILSISAIALLAQGCATTYTWVKPGEPGADDAVDLFNCTNDANRSGAIFNQSDYQSPPVVSESPFSNAGCYNPNVSNVNCLTATPQSLVPQTFDSQFGESSYQLFIDRCMRSKGWQKKVED